MAGELIAAGFQGYLVLYLIPQAASPSCTAHLVGHRRSYVIGSRNSQDARRAKCSNCTCGHNFNQRMKQKGFYHVLPDFWDHMVGHLNPAQADT